MRCCSVRAKIYKHFYCIIFEDTLFLKRAQRVFAAPAFVPTNIGPFSVFLASRENYELWFAHILVLFYFPYVSETTGHRNWSVIENKIIGRPYCRVFELHVSSLGNGWYNLLFADLIIYEYYDDCWVVRYNFFFIYPIRSSYHEKALASSFVVKSSPLVWLSILRGHILWLSVMLSNEWK